MYEIHDLKGIDAPSRYLCFINIQDGSESWHENTLENAIQSVISAARVMNGSYIREDDIIKYPYQKTHPSNISEEDFKILNDIHTGRLATIDPNHPVLKYRILEQEALWIVDIREGRAKLTY